MRSKFVLYTGGALVARTSAEPGDETRHLLHAHVEHLREIALRRRRHWKRTK